MQERIEWMVLWDDVNPGQFPFTDGVDAEAEPLLKELENNQFLLSGIAYELQWLKGSERIAVLQNKFGFDWAKYLDPNWRSDATEQDFTDRWAKWLEERGFVSCVEIHQPTSDWHVTRVSLVGGSGQCSLDFWREGDELRVVADGRADLTFSEPEEHLDAIMRWMVTAVLDGNLSICRLLRSPIAWTPEVDGEITDGHGQWKRIGLVLKRRAFQPYVPD